MVASVAAMERSSSTTRILCLCGMTAFSFWPELCFFNQASPCNQEAIGSERVSIADEGGKVYRRSCLHATTNLRSCFEYIDGDNPPEVLRPRFSSSGNPGAWSGATF